MCVTLKLNGVDLLKGACADCGFSNQFNDCSFSSHVAQRRNTGSGSQQTTGRSQQSGSQVSRRTGSPATGATMGTSNTLLRDIVKMRAGANIDPRTPQGALELGNAFLPAGQRWINQAAQNQGVGSNDKLSVAPTTQSSSSRQSSRAPPSPILRSSPAPGPTICRQATPAGSVGGGRGGTQTPRQTGNGSRPGTPGQEAVVEDLVQVVRGPLAVVVDKLLAVVEAKLLVVEHPKVVVDPGQAVVRRMAAVARSGLS